MQYNVGERDIIEVIAIPWSLIYSVERSDKRHGIYPRVAFMTVFALQPKAII